MSLKKMKKETKEDEEEGYREVEEELYISVCGHISLHHLHI